MSAKTLLIFVLARKRRLDLVTVRAVAERRPPDRSGVTSRFASPREYCKGKLQNFLPAEKQPQNKSLCGVLPCVLFKPRFERFDMFNSHIFSTR